MKLRFTFYSDPGHGWLAVPSWVLRLSGVADKITPYSYINGDTVYLEEDCDYATFMQALVSQDVYPFIVYKNTNNRSRIRGYNSFNAAVFAAAKWD